MTEIRIERDDSNREFEHYLARDLTTAVLTVPNELTEGGALGVSLAFAQFLLSWSRAAGERTLQTYLPPVDADRSYERFTSRAHGLAAAYFANRVLAVDGATDIRQKLLVSARPRIAAMHSSELAKTSRGQSVEMIFIEGALQEFHGSVYVKAPTPTEILNRELHGRLVRNRRDLNEFVKSVMTTLQILPALAPWLEKGSHRPFGALVHEIFRNTAEHAYLTTDGRKLIKNFRCIQFGRSLSSRTRVEDLSVSAPGAAAQAASYFERIASLRGELPRDKIQFFEMSVFDSGPGYAATIRKRYLKEDSDVAAVARCFVKHQTAKGFDAAGLGLYRIREIIEETKGFLRVRTGTVEAFFSATPNLESLGDPEPFVHGSLPAVEGTLVTVGIPIHY